jgi:hypothetical protein
MVAIDPKGVMQPVSFYFVIGFDIKTTYFQPSMPSWDSLICAVTGTNEMLWVNHGKSKGVFSSPKCPEQLLGTPGPLFGPYWGFCLVGKTDHCFQCHG